MWGKRKINPEDALYQYADMVYRLALLQMKNKNDAEDVFQEVFLRLVQYQERILDEEHLKAWLIRVTINCCKKQFNSAWRRKMVSIEEQTEAGYEAEYEENVVYKEVQNLPEKYKTVIHLFYFEEYSVKEIGEITGQKEAAVKTQLSRGRGILKERLKGEFGYEL